MRTFNNHLLFVANNICFSLKAVCNFVLKCGCCYRCGSNGEASADNAGDLGSIPASGRSPGAGDGNPLQYSCLENPMNRGAWEATVHGVAKSWTQLSDFTFINSFATPWPIARQAPLSMGVSRQEHWSGWPCPPPQVLPDPGVEPASLILAGRFFTTKCEDLMQLHVALEHGPGTWPSPHPESSP